MAIKYIIDTFTSKTDRDCNRYSVTRVTHTGTGQSFDVDTGYGDGGNTAFDVKKLKNLEHHHIHKTAQEVSYKAYKAMAASCECCEHERERLPVLLRSIASKKA